MFWDSARKTREEAGRPPDGPAQVEESKVTSQPKDRAATDLTALLGKGTRFEGKLSFEGTVHVDGTFTGQISTEDLLVVGEGARVDADVTCGSLVVHGELNGNVKARDSVELHAPARVTGELATPSLMIEKGVLFVGASKMERAESEPRMIPYKPIEQEAAGVGAK